MPIDRAPVRSSIESSQLLILIQDIPLTRAGGISSLYYPQTRNYRDKAKTARNNYSVGSNGEKCKTHGFVLCAVKIREAETAI